MTAVENRLTDSSITSSFDLMLRLAIGFFLLSIGFVSPVHCRAALTGAVLRRACQIRANWLLSAGCSCGPGPMSLGIRSAAISHRDDLRITGLGASQRYHAEHSWAPKRIDPVCPVSSDIGAQCLAGCNYKRCGIFHRREQLLAGAEQSRDRRTPRAARWPRRQHRIPSAPLSRAAVSCCSPRIGSDVACRSSTAWGSSSATPARRAAYQTAEVKLSMTWGR